MKTKGLKKFNLLFFILALSIICSALSITGKTPYNKAPKGFVYIPPGTLEKDGAEIKVMAFYMAQSEVSNGQYKEFLEDLKVQGKQKELQIATIKSKHWNDYKITEADKYAADYHNWKDYPVVNISKEAAILYCNWLTEKVREETGNKNFPQFRLPEQAEWIWAAKGNLEDEDYPWHNGLKDKKGNYKIQAKALGNKLEPVEVLKLSPNNFGLYNICGNVAEMIAEKGLAMGGSWNAPIECAKTNSSQELQVSPTIGFRPVATYFTN